METEEKQKIGKIEEKASQLEKKAKGIREGLKEFLGKWKEVTKPLPADNDLKYTYLCTEDKPHVPEKIFLVAGKAWLGKKQAGTPTTSAYIELRKVEYVDFNDLIKIVENLKGAVSSFKKELEKKDYKYDELNDFLNQF